MRCNCKDCDRLQIFYETHIHPHRFLLGVILFLLAVLVTWVGR